MLAILTVNLNSDGGITNDGNLLLREAIDYVNGATPAPLDLLAQIDDLGGTEPLGVNDTILFAPSLDVVDGTTITLTQGQLTITESVTIDATALKNGLTVDASGNDSTPIPIAGDDDGIRVFNINAFALAA